MKRVLSIALMALVTLVGAVGVSTAADKDIQITIMELQDRQMAFQKPPDALNTGVQGKPKMYYLTRTQVSGNQAATACSTGFHTANIFEILDTSNLRYATGLPDAFSDIVTIDDQRDGLAVIDFGWVQTGYASTPDPSRDPYESFNCDGQSASSEWGTVARLYDNVTASQMNSQWVGVCARPCNQPDHVWCVKNM